MTGCGRLPEVLECQSLTGEADYVLKVAVADLKRFSDFMSEHLMKAPEVANIRSSIVLESIKETEAYPLAPAKRPSGLRPRRKPCSRIDSSGHDSLYTRGNLRSI